MPIVMQISESKGVCDCCDLCRYPECEYYAKDENDIRAWMRAYVEYKNRIFPSDKYPKMLQFRCNILDNALNERVKRKRRRRGMKGLVK